MIINLLRAFARSCWFLCLIMRGEKSLHAFSSKLFNYGRKMREFSFFLKKREIDPERSISKVEGLSIITKYPMRGGFQCSS